MKFKFSTLAKISIIAFSFAIFLLSPSYVKAGADDNVFGSAWSNNVGWITFNSCTNPTPNYIGTSCGSVDYGVHFDKTTLEVKGHAWSDNVGWISFNPSDWGGTCSPSGASCSGFKNKWQSGGWARVVSAKSGTNTGGFDGWISLGGSNYEAPFDTSTEISASMPADYVDNDIYTIKTSANGFWWGSEVVGWIDLKRTSSYDPADGGIFLVDLSTDTLELTSSATDNTVVAGDLVDNIHWKATGFVPTECIGTMFDSKGKPILNDDWNDTFTYSTVTEGDIGPIEVPYDFPNNAKKIATKFTLLCKNTVKSAAQTITIYAEPLNVFLKATNMCASGGTAKLEWYADGNTNQFCEIEATPASGGSGPYTVAVTGTSPGTADDTDFGTNQGSGPTSYVLSCVNGTGTYQDPIPAKTTSTVKVKECTSDYTVGYSPNCQPFTLVGTSYEATVELSVTPQSGFTDDVTVSDGGGLGSWTFSTSDKFTYTSPNFSKVDATLTLSKLEYSSINWSLAFTRDALFDAVGLSTKTESIKFCESGTKLVKPKYVPF